MALSNLAIFNDWVQGTMSEVLDFNINLFNAATRGGLVLKAKKNAGDYADESFWKSISGLVRRRDAHGSGAVSAVDIDQLIKTSVKVAAGTPPVNLPPSQFNWIGKTPREAGIVVGRQLAEGRLADMIDVAIGAFVAATSAEATNFHDGSAAVADFAVLNTGQAKMGDRHGSIMAWVLHSKPLFDLYGNALANAERLFQYGTVQVLADPFGRPLIVSDTASLIEIDGVSAGIHKYPICGLVNNAVLVEDNADFESVIVDATGDENILRTMQSEWSYNVGCKGFAWDKTNGGASPTTAALVTATNWDKVATSHKDLGGVVVDVR